MDWTLEVVVVPVSDVDRAKSFYADQVGFNVDHDTKVSDEMRIVQLTPPGSGCSIVIGKGITEMEPGTLKGLQLVVADIVAGRAELVGRGVEAGEIEVYDGDASRLTRGGEALDNVGFVHFSDPDGNTWAVQQISARGKRAHPD
jgi:predicted enzyme related to lactoylglutathione lyase